MSARCGSLFLVAPPRRALAPEQAGDQRQPPAGSRDAARVAAATRMGKRPSFRRPVRTIDYEERWLGMGAGPFLGMGFPTRWTSADGRTLWAVFNGGTGSRYHDRLNIVQAVLR